MYYVYKMFEERWVAVGDENERHVATECRTITYLIYGCIWDSCSEVCSAEVRRIVTLRGKLPRESKYQVS